MICDVVYEPHGLRLCYPRDAVTVFFGVSCFLFCCLCQFTFVEVPEVLFLKSSPFYAEVPVHIFQDSPCLPDGIKVGPCDEPYSTLLL
ncbi:unnamed protein product [Rodentolepis nana]|uniref:Ovule protein n=1 Tax=Rodentolepis nana TaxID=102285 RepID=A0A0R3TRI1_RODNA|nr:unnamed protein product [Rodentolepis nana]